MTCNITRSACVPREQNVGYATVMYAFFFELCWKFWGWGVWGLCS